MNRDHFETLRRDFEDSRNSLRRLIIKAKLVYYFFWRPIANVLLRYRLRQQIVADSLFKNIDRLLWDEGGMHKEYVYSICNNLRAIKDSSVLVPGVGYGRNLCQLARWRPKIIVAFDLFEYREEWEYLAKKISDEFAVEVLFFKGDFSAILSKYFNYFDFIISDAVLEHVNNLKSFTDSSRKYLKKDGIFYASFGPLWYGPGGDHVALNDKSIYDHLILSPEEYEKQFRASFGEINEDSCDGAFLAKAKLFSFLRADEYFTILQSGGFKKIRALAKTSKAAYSLLGRNKEITVSLNKNNVPIFDRYCSGFYLWMKLDK